METTPFTITYSASGIEATAEVHPCCKPGDVVDYMIWKNDKLAFAVTKDIDNTSKWVVSLKNADDEIGDETVQQIGEAITKKQSAHE